MGDHFYFRDQDEEQEAEEALSLADFPLDDLPASNEASLFNEFSDRPRRSSSQPQDFFEFFSVEDFSSDHIMCPADDIIICGKLVPFKAPAYLPPHPASNPFVEENCLEQRKPLSKATLGLRSRSESSSNLHSSKTKLTMNSRSLDYRKLQRRSSSNSPKTVNTNSSIKSSGNSGDVLAKRATRSRWSVFMFGMVKIPAEMELEDMKTRQLRRNPSTLFIPTSDHQLAATTGGGKLSISRNKGPWKLLKALSCKDHTSVAITATSLPCLPESFA